MGILFVIALFIAIRLVNLSLLPVFADEAIYIRWAQLAGHQIHYLFIPLSDGKTPLFMWFLSLILKLNSDPLLTGRILSVFSGLASLLGIYFLSKKLFSKPTAFIASLLMVFQPFLFFYDRLSIVDSLLTALLIWSFYAFYMMLIKPSFKSAVIFGLLAGSVLLTKPSGLLFLFLNTLLLALFPLKKIKTAFRPGIIAAIIIMGLYNSLRLSSAFHLISSRSSDYLRTVPEIVNDFTKYFLPTFKVFLSWLISYLSLQAVIVLGIGFFLSVKMRAKKILLLFVWIIIPFLVQVSIGKIIYPRYLLPIIPFILLIIAWTITWFWQKNKLVGLFFTLMIFIHWLPFDYWLLTDPAQAPLVPQEKEQYFQQWSSGYGLKEVKDYLLNLPKDKSVLVVTEGSFGTLPDGLQIFFDQSNNIRILGVGFPDKTVTSDMEQALLSGQSVYLVVNAHRYNLSASDRLTLISQYVRPGGEKLVFYEVH